MKHVLHVCLLIALLTCPVSAQTPPPAAPHAAGGGGRKMELIEGIGADDFLRLSREPKTVELVMVAAFNDENYGMNFNGYAKGNAVYTIPKGWKVNVTFINPSPVPHSLIVIEKDDTRKLQVPEPYFKGAATEKHLQGLAMEKSSFSFLAEEAGEFALACGFPSHTLNGHWLSLIISGDAQTPTLKLGDQAAQEAKPAKSK